MSIEGKHAYRFGYLKSEQWASVRLEALAREGGKCQICGEESIYNDAHHVWYPENIYETTEKHLVILCRSCHDLIHAICPDCKTNNDEIGRTTWIAFRNALHGWLISKRNEGEPPIKSNELRRAYKELQRKFSLLQSKHQRAIHLLKQKNSCPLGNVCEMFNQLQ